MCQRRRIRLLMDIYGLDFTSVPTKAKPIAGLRGHLDGELLRLEAFDPIQSIGAFEEFLMRPGPWVAGMDFPFGQPRKLIENLDWPKSWGRYVLYLATKTRPEFVELLRAYRDPRPKGDKQHLRRTDELANSRSPMMLFGVPVWKMFFEGAHRLLASGACIQPCRPNEDPRVIVEAYPALVARRWAGSRSYKAYEVRKQTEARRSAREDIVRGLRSAAKRHFGINVQFDDEMAQAYIADGGGDLLDALLCAVQAAWGYSKLNANWGIPPQSDPLEGWIVDPALLTGSV